MDFTRLKEFISVADTGSFTAAATLYGVSCATMNARMHAFEEDLGTRLFEPGKKFRLTGAGIALYENAGQLIQHYETLQKSLLNTPDFSIDRLRIRADRMRHAHVSGALSRHHQSALSKCHH